MRRVLFDADEVLLEVQAPLLQAVYEITGKRFWPQDFQALEVLKQLTTAESRSVRARLESPGYCLNYCAGPSTISAISAMRKEADVVALVAPHLGPDWIKERYAWLMASAGFELDSIISTSKKHEVPGDIMIGGCSTSLRAWKGMHPRGLALLWHAPTSWHVPDEPIWFRVCDWDIVQWFVRGGAERAQRLAACG